VNRSARVAFLLVVVLAGGACARALEQRTTQGPTAYEIWVYRMVAQNGREPNFDERRHWEDQVEQQIGAYLRSHPDAANSLDISTFRFERRAAVGMTKEQVMILLGPPLAVTTDAAQMAELARRYWPAMQGQVGEAWMYPLGWHLFFAGARLADITQYLPR
jgi:hypothetical protein